MPYIGNTPTTQSFISGTDYFNGTGSQTAFTLSRTVASINDIQVTVNNVVQQPNDAYTISGTTLTMTSAPSAGTSNVYVRYLSTTTQVITPSQGTVSWSTLNSDVQQDLGISFKNRIINGAMVIDQRNAGASANNVGGAVTYFLDRWLYFGSQASKFSIQQNAGSVTPPAGFTNYLGITSLSAYTVGSSELFAISQYIEGFNCSDLGWGTANAKTVTLSFWVRSSLTGTFGGSFRNENTDRSYPFSYTISAANTWEQKSITVAGDTSGTWLTTNSTGIRLTFSIGMGSTFSGTAGAWVGANYLSTTGATSVVGTNGATFYLTGVQLEVGTQATTFDNRSYGTEFMLCQRYYYLAQGGAARWGANISLVQFYPSYPVQMRTSATATLVGTVRSDNYSGGDPTVSAIATQATGGGYQAGNYVQLTMTGGSGTVSTASGCNIYVNDNRYGIAFSAEL